MANPAAPSRLAALHFTLRTSRSKPHLAPYAAHPLFGLCLTVEAGNVLLHAAGIGNDDVPSAAYFERLRVEGNFVGGFWHRANMPSDSSLRYAVTGRRITKAAYSSSSSIHGSFCFHL
jgi:hypothetical protein